MKKLIISVCIIAVSISNTGASFMFQEIDPICSISWKTHTSFPWEISDTSSWSIPKAYDWECDKTPELSSETKEKVYTIMQNFFKKKNYLWAIYWEQWWYGWNNSLNPAGQKFVNNKLFPAIINFIEKERNKTKPNTRNIALVNAMVQTIGYDYFVTELK